MKVVRHEHEGVQQIVVSKTVMEQNIEKQPRHVIRLK